MKPGLEECENAVIVPHIASATLWTRAGMVSALPAPLGAAQSSVVAPGAVPTGTAPHQGFEDG